MQKIIDAENSDLFDVLAYIAFRLSPISRQERADRAKIDISTHFNTKQQVFLEFVLSQYVKVGVDELDEGKLTPLLRSEVQQCYFRRHGGPRKAGRNPRRICWLPEISLSMGSLTHFMSDGTTIDDPKHCLSGGLGYHLYAFKVSQVVLDSGRSSGVAE